MDHQKLVAMKERKTDHLQHLANVTLGIDQTLDHPCTETSELALGENLSGFVAYARQLSRDGPGFFVLDGEE